MEQMEQCLHCAHRLFFKPLSDETFTCCSAWREDVKSIDIRTGVSPTIEMYGIEGKPCDKFQPGMSICQTKEGSFLIHPIRREGERVLHQLFGI